MGLEFARRNARVILACHGMIEGGLVRLDIVAKSGQNEHNIITRILDMSSLDGVREFAQLIKVHEKRYKIKECRQNVVVFGQVNKYLHSIMTC